MRSGAGPAAFAVGPAAPPPAAAAPGRPPTQCARPPTWFRQFIACRTAFDPKTFYKKPDKTKFPKYFQFGTVVEGAADFFSARMPKSERRATLTEQVLADPQIHAVRLVPLPTRL